jgi:threonine synthase
LDHLDRLPVGLPALRLGENATPLVSGGPAVLLKHEELLPTGSFKARGASVMVGLARSLQIDSMVVDSSGNAGLAAAAYAHAASIPIEVFVPQGTDTAKIAAMSGYGASVNVVKGDRESAARAARSKADSPGVWYASHAHQPAFHHGVKTLAYELAAAMSDEADMSNGPDMSDEPAPSLPTEPSAVMVPAGNGTLVIGLWLGYKELIAAGLVESMPRIIAVQAESCAPLAGLVPRGTTAATGIAIARPPRLGQVRAVLSASGGGVVTVTEEQLASALDDLRSGGALVGPTGAVAWAGWKECRDRLGSRGDAVVVVLTGA